MRATKTLPVALTIAGSDSGGGAGIQADLKTFASLGVHGASVLTCLTAQNPKRVLAIQAARPGLVRSQLEAVWSELPPAAVKTGMLYSKAIIGEVIAFLGDHPGTPLVVDPVMVATSRARLLAPSAVRVLQNELLPMATLVTPNLPEAELLTGSRLRSVEDLRKAARILVERWGGAALVKGGHLTGGREAVDIFFDGRTELLLTAPRVTGVHTHGTGCTYAAAVTGYLARGLALPKAVAQAKDYISRAIAGSVRLGRGHTALNWLDAGRG